MVAMKEFLIFVISLFINWLGCLKSVLSPEGALFLKALPD
jgi:hypothetical protein